jgi:hypothetical protein
MSETNGVQKAITWSHTRIKPGDKVAIAGQKGEAVSVTGREITVSMLDKPNACPHVFDVKDVMLLPDSRWPEDDPRPEPFAPNPVRDHLLPNGNGKEDEIRFDYFTVDHPAHYGGDSTYETIKVIEAWGLDFVEGNILKYLSRYKSKGGMTDLRKAQWYMDRLVENAEKEKLQES